MANDAGVGRLCTNRRRRGENDVAGAIRAAAIKAGSDSICRDEAIRHVGAALRHPAHNLTAPHAGRWRRARDVGRVEPLSCRALPHGAISILILLRTPAHIAVVDLVPGTEHFRTAAEAAPTSPTAAARAARGLIGQRRRRNLRASASIRLPRRCGRLHSPPHCRTLRPRMHSPPRGERPRRRRQTGSYTTGEGAC